MKPTIKLITFSLLLLVFSCALKAQEKYDYATVRYANIFNSLKPGLYISTDKGLEKIDIKREDIKDMKFDNSFLLQHIRKMTDDGWTVINTFSEPDGISFILERKRN